MVGGWWEVGRGGRDFQVNFYPFIYIYTHMFIYYIVPAGVVSSDYQLSFNSMSVSFDLQIQDSHVSSYTIFMPTLVLYYKRCMQTFIN